MHCEAWHGKSETQYNNILIIEILTKAKPFEIILNK
jgi:hypothetical protein